MNETIIETLRGISATLCLISDNYENHADQISEEQHRNIIAMLQAQIQQAITSLDKK